MVSRSWRERWVAWRNNLLKDQGFQRWASGFPLTRSIAHGRADALFNLVAGFVYSQILAACVELKLFDRLAAGPQSVDALAAATDLPRASTERLLVGAASLGLVERLDEERFALGAQGAALLGNAGLSDMIAHHALLYADLADPVALLRRGGGAGALAGFWPYAAYDNPGAAGAESVSAYSALMAASQPMIAADILDAYPLGRHRRLLDVGGGEGAFLTAAAAQAPKLDLMLFDLPAVAGRAQARFDAAGLNGRVAVHGGDFHADALPAGADIISLVRILHDHDDDSALRLLRAIRAALPVNGVLLVAEPMSRAPSPDPMADAYFGLYLLAMGRGRARQPIENMKLMNAVGFRSARLLRTRTPMLVRVLTARA